MILLIMTLFVILCIYPDLVLLSLTCLVLVIVLGLVSLFLAIDQLWIAISGG